MSTPLTHAVVTTVLGPITLVRDDDSLVGLYYREHHPRPDPSRFGQRVAVVTDPLLAEVEAHLNDYVAGTREAFDLPLRLEGSERAQAVWQLIAAIPRGSTISYKTLAEQTGHAIGARAAGGYVGRNPLSIVVPCHRVVGSDGSLTGYAGGVDHKRRLLELEGALAPRVVEP